MTVKLLLFLALTAHAGRALLAQQPIEHSSGNSRLVYALYVSRHGVRSPTAKAAAYDRFSAAAWPAWSVQPGLLTPHGYQLMKLFGAYDAELLTSEHLLTDSTCAEAAHVTFRADSDQRTRETARALAEGMFPHCPVKVDALAEGTNDPLFHLPDEEIKMSESELGAAAIAGRVGGDPGFVAVAYRTPLLALDTLLAQCGAHDGSHARTSILDVPAEITKGAHDHLADMRGPLNTAGTLTENLLLEYAEGFPLPQVGWGCVDGAKVRTLIDLHTAASDFAQRTPTIAVAQSRHLLNAIDLSIEQALRNQAVRGAVGAPQDKAAFLVGHDTNLSNIAGALNLNWIADGRRDDTPPGSALIFELWKSGTDGYAVRVFFTTQTLEQMRDASVLSSAQAPSRVAVFVPGCSRVDLSCDAAAFHRLLSGVAP